MRIVGNCLAQPLRQIRMPAGPVQNALQKAESESVVLSETLGQRCGFALNKVTQLDSSSNVEGGRPRIADQVGGAGHAHQAKCEAGECQVLCSIVVELPNSGKELVRRKPKASHCVNLIDKNDHSAG